jgi:hypothetical protein
VQTLDFSAPGLIQLGYEISKKGDRDEKRTKLLLLALLSIGLYAFGSDQRDAIDDLADQVGLADQGEDVDQYDFSDDDSEDSLTAVMSSVSSNSSTDGYSDELQDGYDQEQAALAKVKKQRDRLQKRLDKLNCFDSDEDFSTQNALGSLWSKIDANQEELEYLQRKETDLIAEIAGLKKFLKLSEKLDKVNQEIENRENLLQGRESSMADIDQIEARKAVLRAERLLNGA